jgi:hypothetical protein
LVTERKTEMTKGGVKRKNSLTKRAKASAAFILKSRIKTMST